MTQVQVSFEFPEMFTVRDMAYIYDMMFDICPGFEAECMVWGENGIELDDDCCWVDSDDLADKLCSHEWDVKPVVTVSDGDREWMLDSRTWANDGHKEDVQALSEARNRIPIIIDGKQDSGLDEGFVSYIEGMGELMQGVNDILKWTRQPGVWPVIAPFGGDDNDADDKGAKE